MLSKSSSSCNGTELRHDQDLSRLSNRLHKARPLFYLPVSLDFVINLKIQSTFSQPVKYIISCRAVYLSIQILS
jgi:hypothetical protein